MFSVLKRILNITTIALLLTLIFGFLTVFSTGLTLQDANNYIVRQLGGVPKNDYDELQLRFSSKDASPNTFNFNITKVPNLAQCEAALENAVSSTAKLTSKFSWSKNRRGFWYTDRLGSAEIKFSLSCFEYNLSQHPNDKLYLTMVSVSGPTNAIARSYSNDIDERIEQFIGENPQIKQFSFRSWNLDAGRFEVKNQLFSSEVWLRNEEVSFTFGRKNDNGCYDIYFDVESETSIYSSEICVP